MYPNNKNAIAKVFDADGIIYALIYCRVSSEKQAKEGHGLEAQEQRCIEYAGGKKYVVLKENIFKDTASGGGAYTSRLGQVGMLKKVDEFPHRRFVVIVDDPARLARDIKAHFALREEFLLRGVPVECPNFNFEDTPEGELSEGVTALANQYQRKVNRRQVVQKMKARLEAGYWTFGAKKGYSFHQDAIHGKLLRPNEDSKLIVEAIDGI